VHWIVKPNRECSIVESVIVWCKKLRVFRTVVVKTVGLHVPFLSLIVMKCSPEVTLEKKGRLDTLRHPTCTHNHHILKRQLL
jgi:hypothetical protein